MALLNLTESQKLWHFNLVIVLVLGILFIAKMNPISETFSCNEKRICSLSKTYFIPPLNRTKEIKLYAGASLEPIEKYHYSKSASYYTYHLGLDNRGGRTIKLFSASSGMQKSRQYDPDYQDEVFKNEIREFNEYKISPARTFKIQSKAEEGDFAFWLYAWIIVITVLMLWNILDKYKGTI